MEQQPSQPNPQPGTSKDRDDSGLDKVAKRTDRMILEAEHFKAAIATPPEGTSDLVLSRQFGQGCGLSDDELFHLTCHIDKNTQDKIEHGDFVDLEKLVPKDRLFGGSSGDGSPRLEWVQKDGQTFLTPANSDKNIKITSFRKWEQAFRMYATIYCGANPSRAREIWQYISVINTAASSYVWDNVYNYDIIFRHLMAYNPQRSWSKTYNQMWNLSMYEPLQRGSFSKPSYGHNFVPNQSANTVAYTNKQDKKNRYCSNWNKGVKCKFGKSCHFVERSSYCDSSSHGLYNCPKADKKDKEKILQSQPKVEDLLVDAK